MANNKNDMDYMVRKLVEEYEKCGRSVNTKKVYETNLIIDNNKDITASKDYKYIEIMLD